MAKKLQIHGNLRPEGSGNSWNDLADKPFYEETTTVGGDTLTWDGNTEGLEVFPDSPFYRVSDVTLTSDDLTNGGTIGSAVGTGEEIEAFTTMFDSEMNAFYLSVERTNASVIAAIIILSDVTMDGVALKAGTYFFDGDDGRRPKVRSLQINGYTGFTTTTTELKTIDPKYLPEHLQFGEESKEEIFFEGTVPHMYEIKNGFEVGEKYTVVYDGVTYNFVVFDDGGYPTIGAPFQNFSEYPFNIYCTKDTGLTVVCFEEGAGAEHTISITSTIKSIKPLDEKYLPESYIDSKIQAYIDEAILGGAW